MAFLEWRKFNFFDLKKEVDKGRLAEIFKETTKETKISTVTCGKKHLIVGDSLGQIHMVSSEWEVQTFRGYEISVDHAQQLRNSSYLITIGHDDAGISPILKVWDTSRLDKNGTPYCCRVSKISNGFKPMDVGVLAVHEELQLMGVGLIDEIIDSSGNTSFDGCIILYRGDITRDRSAKQRVLRGLNSAITGMAFKISASSTYLFVSTERSVLVYNISQKDKEIKCQLDNLGCGKNCSVLAESTQESHFMIGRNDAIYCYTPDGRGPCYAVDGEKIMLEWFRTYLVIISKSNRPVNMPAMANDTISSGSQGDLITVLDIHNKFIVFSCVMPNIRAVLNLWGSFFIMDEENRMYHLDEKDLQSKLSLLFKKNLYDVAIRIAKCQQYHSDGLVDIFKQYGDHLCQKLDYQAAVEQYIKTIGKLEPSYVIRKFLDSQHLDKLTMYLQALHKHGQATEDHTTLLLNCYTKLNNTVGQSNSLKEFIQSKESDLNYDVDVAIKVCRHGSPAEALMLAKKHEKHDWYIKIQIEDNQKFSDVLQYISNLKFEEAEHYMKEYGQILVEKLPKESTELLKRLCTNYKPLNAPLISENAIAGNYDVILKADPEDFIHLFLNNSERLVEFLEHLISENCLLSASVYNTLLEHYLQVWSNAESVVDKNKFSQKILKLLQDPDAKCDKSQALVLCHRHSFSEGILYLYEEQKLYQQILRYHISLDDTNSVLACCRRFGHQEPTLWVHALWACVREPKKPSMDLLNEILTVIAKERLFAPQLVVDAIGTGKAEITLGHVRSYITNELQQEMKKTKEISELTDKYKKDTEKLKQLLESLKSGVIEIRGSRCAACHHPLELPTIHFLCQHSFHQHCFQSFVDDENQCPTCQPENKNLLDLLQAREYNKDLHEMFHSQLEKAHDGFSVAAEYFGRGVFNNKYKEVVDQIIQKQLFPTEKLSEKPYKPEQKPRKKTTEYGSESLNYGSGAEGKIRQTEGPKSKVRVESISEGRMRAQEASRYGSSLSSSISRSIPKSFDSKKSYDTKQPIKNTSLNPFGDDDDDDDENYDQGKNPFCDEEENKSFKDDFYNDNLNPFE